MLAYLIVRTQLVMGAAFQVHLRHMSSKPLCATLNGHTLMPLQVLQQPVSHVATGCVLLCIEAPGSGP